MKSLLVIHPYKHEAVRVFDDEKAGLTGKPCVVWYLYDNQIGSTTQTPPHQVLG